MYHGKGKLVTSLSTYDGDFKDGVRHGIGNEYFNQSGLRISGIFINNRFSNDQEEIEHSRIKSKFKENLLACGQSKVQLNPEDYNKSHLYNEFNYDFETVHSEQDDQSFIIDERSQGERKFRITLKKLPKPSHQRIRKMSSSE